MLGNADKLVFAFLLFCVMLGCEEKQSFPIPDDKLVILLRDVHIAETSILHLQTRDRDSILNLYYEQICEMHDVERADLDSCIVRIKRNPETAYPYYEKVHEELEKLNLKKK